MRTHAGFADDFAEWPILRNIYISHYKFSGRGLTIARSCNLGMEYWRMANIWEMIIHKICFYKEACTDEKHIDTGDGRGVPGQVRAGKRENPAGDGLYRALRREPAGAALPVRRAGNHCAGRARPPYRHRPVAVHGSLQRGRFQATVPHYFGKTRHPGHPLPHPGGRHAGAHDGQEVRGTRVEGRLHRAWVPLLQGCPAREQHGLLSCGMGDGQVHGRSRDD